MILFPEARDRKSNKLSDFSMVEMKKVLDLSRSYKINSNTKIRLI